MRRALAPGAAVILALGLVASGCGLVDSLTPFGIGTRDYGGGSENVNGDWTGSTGNGGDFAFQVATDKVLDINFTHVTADCSQPFELTAKVVQVVDNTFVHENNFDTQGSIIVQGRFTSASTCTGSYTFKGLAASRCADLTSGTGTFTATKTR